jgi:sec-independent protein translocase protein TatC
VNENKQRFRAQKNPQGEMTLIDHLRELRKRIIVSMIAILCGAIVSYIFFDSIVTFLFEPFREIDALSIRD